MEYEMTKYVNMAGLRKQRGNMVYRLDEGLSELERRFYKPVVTEIIANLMSSKGIFKKKDNSNKLRGCLN